MGNDSQLTNIPIAIRTPINSILREVSPNMLFNFSSKQIKQVVLDEECYTEVRENADIDEILDDLGYTANDLMNVSFVFIVEGKQDKNRLPLLLSSQIH